MPIPSLQPTAVLHPHPSSTSPTQSVSKSAIHGKPNGRSPIPSTTNQRPFSHHQHTKPTAVITPTSHHQTAPNRSRNFATQEGQTAVLPSLIATNQRPFPTPSLTNSPTQPVSSFCYPGSQTAVIPSPTQPTNGHFSLHLVG